VILVLTIAKKKRTKIESVSEEIITLVIGLSSELKISSKKSKDCWIAKRAKIIIAYIVNVRRVFLYAVMESASNKIENIPIPSATAFSNPSNASV